MAETLAAEGERLMADDPGAALGVWFTLSRAGLADDSSPFSPRAAIQSGADPVAVASALSQRPQRESLYDAVREERDDWAEVFAAGALAETDAAVVGKLAAALVDENPELWRRIVDGALNRPQVHPGAFVWLATAASDDEELRKGRELRLFRQLLAAPSRPELSSYRAALAPLLDSGGTLPKLVSELSDDDAEAALDAVNRSSALEDYQRTPLVNSLELRFASLRKEGDDALYALPASIEARQEEVRQLREVEIPENRQAIQEAAALGDLRENFEYKSARQRHEYLSARLAGLVADLARVQPIDLATLGDDKVRIGSTVVLASDGGRREITILGPWESDPEAGRLSYQSEMGKRLMGAVTGASIELEDGEYQIEAIHAFETS